jgi:hypothetical protein
MTAIAKKARLCASAAVLLGLCVAASPTRAQTVEDYEGALTAATQAVDVDAACRPLVNYTFVSMSEADKVGVFPLTGLVQAIFGADDETTAPAQIRAACLTRMKQPVIVFDGGSGQDIVAQPPLEDPNKPVGEQRPYY